MTSTVADDELPMLTVTPAVRSRPSAAVGLSSGSQTAREAPAPNTIPAPLAPNTARRHAENSPATPRHSRASKSLVPPPVQVAVRVAESPGARRGRAGWHRARRGQRTARGSAASPQDQASAGGTAGALESEVQRLSVGEAPRRAPMMKSLVKKLGHGFRCRLRNIEPLTRENAHGVAPPLSSYRAVKSTLQ